MQCRLAAAIVASWIAFATPPAIAQGAAPTGPTPEYLCGLLTRAQVEKEIGRKLYSDPEGMRIGGGAVCDFDGGEAQVMLATGPGAEASSVNKGEPAEKALAPTLALVKLVLPKLR